MMDKKHQNDQKIEQKRYDLIVIGAGPAGLAAAEAAFRCGVKNILLLERDVEAGGILNQCIHNGFGLHHFKEELTGPEYAAKFIDLLKNTTIEVLCDAMVLSLHSAKENSMKEVEIVSPQGVYCLQSRAVILAMGCRERTRGAIQLPGTRPAGIFTAGAAQRYINIEGYQVGKRVLILGSGDIGLIMARRLTWEGAEVLACVEKMPYSGGLNRNIVQCLQDFSIPLYLSHTIIDIRGKDRVAGVTIAEVDAKGQAIPGTEKDLECDTILLSVGLIPENELSVGAGIEMDPRTKGPRVNEKMETSIPGIFACGNVVHVHDLVDFVTEESQRAGEAAANYLLENFASAESEESEWLCIEPETRIVYTVPQYLTSASQNLDFVRIFFRVRQAFNYPVKLQVVDAQQNKVLAQFKKTHLLPGEMESIRIPVRLLSGCANVLQLHIVSEGRDESGKSE